MHSASAGKGMDSWYGLISWEFLAVFCCLAVSSLAFARLGVTASEFLPGRPSGAAAALPVPHNPVLMTNGGEAFSQYD
jgi:hypothetical protein